MKNINKYLVNVSFVLITAVFAAGCCFMPGGMIDGIKNKAEGIIKADEHEQKTPEIVDHGTFTGVPLNSKISSIPISGQAIDVEPRFSIPGQNEVSPNRFQGSQAI